MVVFLATSFGLAWASWGWLLWNGWTPGDPQVRLLVVQAAFAPALGMIGTLIGLVAMLKSMNDPSTIGPSMAVALLTTFYGASLANLVFLPMAGKLRNRSRHEVLAREMMLEGLLAISKGENPRIVEEKLSSYLPPAKRRPQD